jgi:hypothetical protein
MVKAKFKFLHRYYFYYSLLGTMNPRLWLDASDLTD